MAEQDRLDLIIFGATGYTGKYAVKNLAILSKTYNVSWAVAGRNVNAAQATLQWASKKTGVDLVEIRIIKADLENEDSILTMAKKGRVILNCVGPYTWYGEKVVKACIKANTHHVDITGEPYFMEYIQYEYNERAKENGTYIVSACGIEVLPIDVGILKLQDKFNGQINSVNCYTKFGYERKLPQKGAALHTGTWDSAILIGQKEDSRKAIHKKLYPYGLKQFEPIPQAKGAVHQFKNGYGVESIGPDFSVVSRSQQTLYELEGRRPATFRSYFLLPNFFVAWIFYIIIQLFLLFVKFNFFSFLLSKTPKILTFGHISKEGPDEQELENFNVTITIQAEGYDDTQLNKKNEVKQSHLIIKCLDPAYNMTATILVLAGIMLVKEKHNLTGKGGVFTPGALFYKTSIMEELIKQGMSFEFDN